MTWVYPASNIGAQTTPLTKIEADWASCRSQSQTNFRFHSIHYITTFPRHSSFQLYSRKSARRQECEIQKHASLRQACLMT